MVRTRSECTSARVSAKAPRKMTTPAPTGSAGKSSKRYEGGNSYCPRETPYWQKEITSFFVPKPSEKSEDGAATSSSSSSASNTESGSNSTDISGSSSGPHIEDTDRNSEKTANLS